MQKPVSHSTRVNSNARVSCHCFALVTIWASQRFPGKDNF